MRPFIKIYLLFISFLALSACAAGGIQVPEKYALGSQLEEVPAIFKYGITSWEKIDNQSLILQKGPGDYYLLVLQIPAPELPFRNRIKLSSTGDMIRAGLDDVIFYSSAHMSQSYPIDRIYRLRGTDQMRAVRDQLTGEMDGAPQDERTVRPSRPGLINNNSVEI